MIITISGSPGSGKSTIAKLLAKKLRLKHYSIGDFMREIAEKRGITLAELSKIAESDRSVDKELDARQIRLGKEEHNFIIDSRLGYHFIPDSIKIYLDVSVDEGSRRIFQDKREGENAPTLSAFKKLARSRIRSEKLRYKQYYNINFPEKKRYDLFIDTTDMSIEQVLKKIIRFVEKK